MAALLGSAIPGEVGLRLLLCPLGSNIVTRTACCGVGIALPIYSTFKAIEEKDGEAQEKWLLYWAVYGSFSVVEVFSDKILSWFPLYYHMKFAFLVWLQLPSGNGSKHLYAKHLRPFLLKHEARLDQLLSYISNGLKKFIILHQREIQVLKALLKSCSETASQVFKEITQPGQPRRPNMTDNPNGPSILHIQDPDSDADN